MIAQDILSTAFLAVGAAFFFAGTVGLLRFPDVFSRLHAVTKADNLGLGFVIVGLAFDVESIAVLAKLAITWALVMVSSSVSCQLIARQSRAAGMAPWRRT